MMTTPKQKILNIISENRGLATILSDIGDYATPGALMKVLKDEKKEFEKFHGLVKVVKYIYPNIEDEKKWMGEYALTLDVKKQTARYMIEYAEINKLFKLKKQLIEKMIDCGNSTSRAWAQLYNIDQQYVDGEISLKETVDKLSAFTYKSTELNIIKTIFKGYCYLDKKSYNMVKEVISDIEDSFKDIKDDYLRDLLYGRYLLLKVSVSFRQNDVEIARSICKKITNEISNEYIISMTYLHLGNSYIVDNYKASYKYLQKGLLLSSSFNPKACGYIKESLNFLANVWGQEPMYLNYESDKPTDIHEIAFDLVNKGNSSEAILILENMDYDNLSYNEKAFHNYIMGKATNQIQHFCSSVKYFIKSNDIYFRKLPIIELQKMGIQQEVLEILAV